MLRRIITSLFVCLPFFLVSAQEYSPQFRKFQEGYQNALDVSVDSANALAQAHLNKFEKEVENKLLLRYLADTYFDMGKLAASDSLYAQLLPWFKQRNMHGSVLSVYKNRGAILYQTGEIGQALALADEALLYLDEFETDLQSQELQLSVSSIYRNLAIAYAIQSEREGFNTTDQAEKYFRKAYTILRPFDVPKLKGLALFNIGNIKQEEDSILHYWQLALDIFESHNYKQQIRMVSGNMASYYIDQKEDYSKGIQYLQRIDLEASQDPNPYMRAIHFIKYGGAYLGLEYFEGAISKLKEGLAIAQEYELYDLERESSSRLMEAYKRSGRYKEALEANEIYDAVVKKMDRLEVERITRETEAKYKTREQADEIKILKQAEQLGEAKLRQQKLILIIALISFLMVSLAGYFLWKDNQTRKKRNLQLEQADKDKTRFLVNVSHELRTPLTLINGPLEDTFDQLKNNNIDVAEKNLKKIANNTKKLIQLTDEVLAISRYDEGYMQANPTPTNLSDFLPRVFYAFQSLASRNEVDWDANIEVPDETYQVDAAKLEKVLNNLLSNAVKHTPKGRKVFMEAKADNTRLSIQLVDTGRGISPDALPQIFNRYYQEENAPRPSGGLGIGLSFVKELVQVMEGEITVESELGKGTTFHLSIPIVVSEQKFAASSEDIAMLDLDEIPIVDVDVNPDKESHVLVVEDNPEMSDFIRQLLSKYYKVSIANNGKEGLERLKANTYDAITVDVMMPEMDGIEFVSQIKQHSHWKQLPVVMISALSSEADKVQGLRLGIDDYVTKPFSARELVTRIENLIANNLVRKTQKAEDAFDMVGTEQKFLDTAKRVVEEHMDVNDFSVKDLAEALNLSERQANRTLKRLTGLSSLQLIREIRLKHAYTLLETRAHTTIAEVAYAIGFENTSYFTKLFTKRFGKKPSDML